MAKEVIRPVPARVTVPATIPVQSRIVTVGIAVGAGVGATAMVITDPIANNFVIKSITVTISTLDLAIIAWVRWQLFIGSGAQTSAGVVRAEWEHLFKEHSGTVYPDLRVVGTVSMFHTVHKAFKERPWRLAAYLYNWSAAVGCDIIFALEISEG